MSHHELCTKSKAEPETPSLHQGIEYWEKTDIGRIVLREHMKKKKTVKTIFRDTIKEPTKKRGNRKEEIVMPAYKIKIKRHLTVYFSHS